MHSRLRFGSLVRQSRLQKDGLSLRGLARAANIQPSYLSRIERGVADPPGEEAIKRLGNALGQDPDVLLAAAGKVSSDLAEAICERPALFAEMIRRLKRAPDRALREVATIVKDGDW